MCQQLKSSVLPYSIKYHLRPFGYKLYVCEVMMQESTRVFGCVVIRVSTTLSTIKILARHDSLVMTIPVPMQKDLRNQLSFILMLLLLSIWSNCFLIQIPK